MNYFIQTCSFEFLHEKGKGSLIGLLIPIPHSIYNLGSFFSCWRMSQVWVPAATPTATDISLHERQEISSSIGAMKYIEDMDDGANSAAADEARVEGRDRWQPAAFIAFGVYMCGSSMPWLPFQPTNKFDVAQVRCARKLSSFISFTEFYVCALFFSIAMFI